MQRGTQPHSRGSRERGHHRDDLADSLTPWLPDERIADVAATAPSRSGCPWRRRIRRLVRRSPRRRSPPNEIDDSDVPFTSSLQPRLTRPACACPVAGPRYAATTVSKSLPSVVMVRPPVLRAQRTGTRWWRRCHRTGGIRRFSTVAAAVDCGPTVPGTATVGEAARSFWAGPPVTRWRRNRGPPSSWPELRSLREQPS